MSADNTSTTNFHRLHPDYDRPVYQLPQKAKDRIQNKLRFLYGEENAEIWFPELQRILGVYYAYKSEQMILWEQEFEPEERFSEKDVILITYGDLVRGRREKPLDTMCKLCKRYLKGAFNTLHILPFFPYSSDRGFAIMDFEEVDPQLGNWDDILDLKEDFKLMFDGVFNHVSARSRWFQEFLNQNPEYLNFFTVFSTKEEISPDHLKIIVRPRTTEVLTPYKTLNGTRLVWTTFSPDQIDLNFKTPKVLLKMIEILLTYVRRGADIVRLDAVTYLWEELGTSCVHLDQSHAVIKLFRDILDAVAPHVALITETNVTHRDNIRYFGNGRDEAQMVYNFALPPLVIHAFQTQDTSILTKWAMNLENVSDSTTYFNFLDSHDGIGVMAVKGILAQEEIEMMALRVLEHGGYISYKDNGDGTVSPYELNITWYSAINREDAKETREIQFKRYFASRSIALVMMGVPGIYLHGLLGSKNDAEAVIEQKHTRSINRTTISKKELLAALGDQNSNIYKIAAGLIRLIRKRIKEKAFHPNAPQKILPISEKVFALVRSALDGSEHIVAMTNVTDSRQHLVVDLIKYQIEYKNWKDILSRNTFTPRNGKLHIELAPYAIVWLKSNH
jgi:sucrose phosphorylase